MSKTDCTLIVPYLTHWAEVLGNAYRMITNLIFLLQDKKLKIVLRANYYHFTTPLFIWMNTLKFVFFIIKRFYSYFDYVKSKKQLPPGIQDLFRLRRTNYFYVNVIMTYCFLMGAFGHIVHFWLAKYCIIYEG